MAPQKSLVFGSVFCVFATLKLDDQSCVVVPDALGRFAAKGAFTIEAAVQFGSLALNQHIAGKWQPGAGASWMLWLDMEGFPAFAVNAGRQQSVASKTKAVIGQWYHLRGVYDGKNKISFFLDGELQAEKTLAAPINAPTGPLVLGAAPKDWKPLTGLLDEVKYLRA